MNDDDIKFLKLYLDGVSKKNIIAEVFPEGGFCCNGNTAFDNTLSKVRHIVSLPWAKKDAVKNKEGILKNLDIYLAHRERIRAFKEAEEQRMQDEGFKYYYYD